MDVARGAVGDSEALTRLTKGTKKTKKFRPSSTGSKQKEIGGHMIRPWADSLTAERIPNACKCIWNYTNGRWVRKFWYGLCPVHLRRESQ